MTERSERELELAFLDRMLEEECGSARPPDLAKCVSAPSALRALPSRRGRGSWLAAALVLLGIAVVFGLATGSGEEGTRPAQDPDRQPEPVIVEPEDMEAYRGLLDEAVGIEVRLVRQELVSDTTLKMEREERPVMRVEEEDLALWTAALRELGEDLSVQVLAEPVDVAVRLKGDRVMHVMVLGGRQPHASLRGIGFREAPEELLRLVAVLRRELLHRQRIGQGHAATLQELAELPADSPRVRAPDLGAEGLRHLDRFTALRRLEFPGMTSRVERLLGDDGVGQLVALPSLQQVEALELPARQSTDAGIERLECLKELRELELLGGGAGITGAGFRQFRKSGLERVRLERCEGLTVEGLRALAALPALRRLELVAPPWEARGIVAELPSFPNLRELALQGTPLIVDSPALLEPLQRTRIEVLDLSTCPDFDPDALAPLEHLPTLRVLKLVRVPVTDDALPVLAKLEQLAEIDVTWTKMTKEGVEALREALPDTIVRAPVFQ